MAGQYFGDNEIKADKVTSVTGSSSLDISSGRLAVVNDATLVDQVPTMTSESLPSGLATASSIFDSNNTAWRAFDKNTTTKWLPLNVSKGYLRYDFGVGEVITRYDITGAISGALTRAPKTWTFEGSYDGKTWVILDTQTNVATWTALEKRQFTITNTNAYRTYRLNVSANQGDALLSVVELNLMGKTSVIDVMDSNGFATFKGSNPQSILDVGGAIYNAKAFGALGDSKTLFDGAITTATNIFTSATANFTTADVGKMISIKGAGPQNASDASIYMMQAFITDYVDAQTVLTNINATTTVTGARFTYGTNDKPAVQKALDIAYNAGGGIVYLPPGSYRGNSGDTLTINSNVTLIGAGMGATKVHMTVQFAGGISGSGAPLITNAYMRDFTIDGAPFTFNLSGIVYNNTQDCSCINVQVINVPYWSILGAFAQGTPVAPSIYFKGCIFDRGYNSSNPAGQDMTAFNYNDYVSMKDCEFRNNTNGFATLLFFSVQNKIELESLRFVNCTGAHSYIDTNGLNVSIKNVLSDGGSTYIRGQILKIDGLDDYISDNIVNGTSHFVESASCQITNCYMANRYNGGTINNTAAMHVTADYRSLGANPNFVNAATAGDTVLTFSQAPPGFANGMKFRIVDNGDLSNNLEYHTIVSGAGTTTWTIDAPLTLSHPARYVVESTLNGDYTVQNSRFGTMTLENSGEASGVTLRFRDLLVSTAGDSYGWIGMPQGSTSQTTPFTVNLDWDHVDVNGGIGFAYFAPATNLITYKGIIRNTRVFGNSTNSWVPAGRINLAQNMQVRFENIELFTGWQVSAGTVFNNGTVFRNIRSSQTGAPIALPTGIGTTPSVPASNAALTNNSGIDATVHISGGTVTVVKVGATTTGLTSPCTIRVPVGQTITLTYSVAPTWVWLAE
jgi:hypothetical protein